MFTFHPEKFVGELEAVVVPLLAQRDLEAVLLQYEIERERKRLFRYLLQHLTLSYFLPTPCWSMGYRHSIFPGKIIQKQQADRRLVMSSIF